MMFGAGVAQLVADAWKDLTPLQRISRGLLAGVIGRFGYERGVRL